MHELFITAVVPDEKLTGMLMIMQGICGMTPNRTLKWRLFFEGPKTLPLPAIGQQIQSRKGTNLERFRELSKQIQRSSYFMTVSYELDPSEFYDSGRGNSGNVSVQSVKIDLAEREGTLRFLDFPEATGTKTYHSRLAITIPDETQLPSFLATARYRYTRDSIQESYCTYKDNTIYRLSRDYLRPQSHDEVVAQNIPSALPAFDELIPFDPERKWILTASAEVSDGTQPDLIKRATEELEQVKHDLEGICEFTMTARQKLDTRMHIQR